MDVIFKFNLFAFRRDWYQASTNKKFLNEIREYESLNKYFVPLRHLVTVCVTPVEFFLFSNLKSTLKCHRFLDGGEDRRKFAWDLRSVPQNTFQDAFQNWKKRWERCINSGREYFEGDKFKL
jgi:hypothetical protein